MPQRSALRAVLCLLALCLLSACGGGERQGSVDRTPRWTASLFTHLRTFAGGTRSAVVTDRPEPDSQSTKAVAVIEPVDWTEHACTEHKPACNHRRAPEPRRHRPRPAPGPRPSKQPTPGTDRAQHSRQLSRSPRRPATRTSTVDRCSGPGSVNSACSVALLAAVRRRLLIQRGREDRADTDGFLDCGRGSPLVLVAGRGWSATWLLVRATQTRTWLTAPERRAKAEVAWFAVELGPAAARLRILRPVAGRWHVAAPRVRGRGGPADRARSRRRPARRMLAGMHVQLRDAGPSAREKMETLSGPGGHDEWDAGPRRRRGNRSRRRSGLPRRGSIQCGTPSTDRRSLHNRQWPNLSATVPSGTRLDDSEGERGTRGTDGALRQRVPPAVGQPRRRRPLRWPMSHPHGQPLLAGCVSEGGAAPRSSSPGLTLRRARNPSPEDDRRRASFPRLRLVGSMESSAIPGGRDPAVASPDSGRVPQHRSHPRPGHRRSRSRTRSASATKPPRARARPRVLGDGPRRG
jgi:hypothetical protein